MKLFKLTVNKDQQVSRFCFFKRFIVLAESEGSARNLCRNRTNYTLILMKAFNSLQNAIEYSMTGNTALWVGGKEPGFRIYDKNLNRLKELGVKYGMTKINQEGTNNQNILLIGIRAGHAYMDCENT